MPAESCRNLTIAGKNISPAGACRPTEPHPNPDVRYVNHGKAVHFKYSKHQFKVRRKAVGMIKTT
jgi:hypothetical protein